MVGIWGSTWVLMRAAIANLHLSPEGMAVGRHLVASLVFAACLPFRRPPPLVAGELPRLAWAGAIGIAFYNLLTGWGQRSVGAGLAAVIIQTAPVWTALGAWWCFRERAGRGVWLGMAAAIAGVALIGLGSGPVAGSPGDFAMLVAAALAFTGYNLWMRPVAPRIGGWWATAWAVWIGTLCLLPWTGCMIEDLRRQPWTALAVWSFLGVFATAAAYAMWTALAAAVPLARASLFLYLIPVLALAEGWAILGENPGITGLAGAACILGGVVLAQRLKP